MSLDQLPWPMLACEDVRVLFATPGASIPGRSDLDAIGAVVEGAVALEVMGVRRPLAELQSHLTVRDGLRLRGLLHQPLPIGPVTIEHARVDIAVGPGVAPRFIVHGDARLLGVHTDIEMHIARDRIRLAAAHRIGQRFAYDFALETPELAAAEGARPSDLRLASTLHFDLGGWLATDGTAAVQRFFEDLLPDLADLENERDEARAAVRRVEDELAQARQAAAQDRAPAQQRLAELTRQAAAHERWLREIDNATAELQEAVEPVTGSVLGRAAAVARNRVRQGQMAVRQAQRRVATTLAAAVTSALQHAQEAATTNAELDPRVLALTAQREAHALAARHADGLLEQCAGFSACLQRVLDYLGDTARFSLQRGALLGDPSAALEGTPVVLELGYRVEEDDYRDRYAFSLVDEAANTGSFEHLALGLALVRIRQIAASLPAVPHQLLDRLEALYQERQQHVQQRLEQALHTHRWVDDNRPSPGAGLAERLARELLDATSDHGVSEPESPRASHEPEEDSSCP